MKVLACVLLGAIVVAIASTRPTLADPPPVACFNSHCDSALDISHADITASLIGCDARATDRVLINGKPQDGVLWTLFSISPAREKPIDPEMRMMMTPLHIPAPVSYPELRFRLKPGYYAGLTVSVGDCSFGPLPLATTGASGGRHIVLVRQESPASPTAGSSELGGVYGYAPLPDLEITLAGGNPEQTLVARDEVDPNPLHSPHGEIYMYFFDAVEPGRYTMIVSGFGWTKSLGEVVVSKAGEMVLRFIHDEELDL